jgi:uncharacterized protein (TIGR03435 family)
MKCTLSVFFMSSALLAQALKPGMPAPPIASPPLDAARPFQGWEAFRGNFVVIDFWATWCGPCIPGLDKVAAMEKEFAGQPVRFLTVASDTMNRVKKYFADKGITLQTYVQGETYTTSESFGVTAIPAAAVIDREGRVVGVTQGENVTPSVLRRLLAGEKVELPGFDREENLTWDQDEITWQDGVLPDFQVVIKPIQVSHTGTFYKPGANRISGDGAPVQLMIQTAWQTDAKHLDTRDKLSGGMYRFAAVVPKGRELELFPALQDALQRSFGFRARWEEQERDVLVLTRDGSAALNESAADPLFTFSRGKITMKKQSTAKLADTLPNGLRKPVVDETGLHGLYDFDLEYRDDGPKMLTEGLQQKYGLILTPARRNVQILVVEKKD